MVIGLYHNINDIMVSIVQGQYMGHSFVLLRCYYHPVNTSAVVEEIFYVRLVPLYVNYSINYRSHTLLP